MELAAITRTWRRRIAVALGALGALALALFMALPSGREPRPCRGRLDARDRRQPGLQLVNAAPVGLQNVAWRAAPLSDLMASESMRAQVAELAGVPSDRLSIVDGTLEKPSVETPLAVSATQAARAQRGPDQLVVRFDQLTSIISLDARAPSRTGVAGS